MEVEFDIRFKHPWTMIVSRLSSSGKTGFTKQVMNKSINNLNKYVGSIPNGKTDKKFARESDLCLA